MQRGEWMIQTTDTGFILRIRPLLGGMFWSFVAYSCLWIAPALWGVFFTRPSALALVIMLPAAPAIAAAVVLAQKEVTMQVGDSHGYLALDGQRADLRRTFRRQHLLTIRTQHSNRIQLFGLWFLQLRSLGRQYGAEFYGPIEFVSYGSKVYFGGSLKEATAEAIVVEIRNHLDHE
ncbi:MAG: hypothetical protein AB2L09_09315 [Coriobacteriia bacterium]